MPDLTSLLSRFLNALYAGSASMPVGSGTATGTISSVLTVNTTQAGTGADTNETDLWTYSLPANTLNANGKTLRVSVWGTTSANANTKTVKVYFGTTGITVFVSAANNLAWTASFFVVRKASNSQDVVRFMDILGNTAQSVSITSTTEAETAAIAIKVTGQNGTAAANDIVFKGAIVEAIS